MKKVIIWGASSMGVEICQKIFNGKYPLDSEKRKILFCVDSNSKKWNKKILKHQEIICQNPTKIFDTTFDEIIVASWTSYKEIIQILETDFNIPPHKINADYCKLAENSRKIFLESFAKQNNQWHSADFSVAELGVFQGEFAKEINRYFPHNKLYLFDTFDGFDLRDLDSEDTHIQELGSHLSNTSIDIVMKKMPNPQQVIIKQGWFPQSCYTDNIEGGGDVVSKKFCFVNIDTDLHDSVIAGLEFFYPRMEKGGVILVHDYFSFFYTGVKKAVDTFCHKEKNTPIPIGDILSIAIVK